MKKLLFLAFAFIMFSSVSNAQIKKPSNNNQSIVEQAVKDGIIIINQSYNLKNEDNKYFGRNDDSDFGNTISVGLLFNGGVLLNNKVVNPQDYDSLYMTKYKDKYDAVNSETKYRTIEDRKFKNIKFAKNQVKSLEKGYLYQFTGNNFEEKGFVIDYREGLKDGWLVWVMGNVNEKNIDDIKIVPARTEIDINKNSSIYDVKQIETNKTILGGFFVKQVVSGVGKITFKLVGVLVPDGEKWSLMSLASVTNQLDATVLPEKEEVLEEEDATDNNENSDEGLIQISGGKKKRK